MHVSIRTDPAFDFKRSRGQGDDFYRSELGVVSLNHVQKAAVAKSFLPPGLKAEGVTYVLAGVGDGRGARMFLRGPDGRMNSLIYGEPAEGVPSRFAFTAGAAKAVAVSKVAVQALRASPDAKTREAVENFLSWVGEKTVYAPF
jgi:hypothetical protein